MVGAASREPDIIHKIRQSCFLAWSMFELSLTPWHKGKKGSCIPSNNACSLVFLCRYFKQANCHLGQGISSHV